MLGSEGTLGTVAVIGGPTASGKTRAAIELAKHFNTEVINADSRQFYKAMRIGTARPREEELEGVRHHFIGHLALEETWSAGAFARAAEPVLRSILGANGIAILTGGSGLYLDALLKGLDPLPATDVRLREKLIARVRDHGLQDLLLELERLDPITHATLDQRNPHRVIRALEICLISGRPASTQRSTPRDRQDVRIIRLHMELPREVLYAKIDARVDQMVRNGLVEEARALLPFRHLNALRTVGYREMFPYFDDEYGLLDAIEKIKQHTRNYAKRQLTWSRREKDVIRIHPSDIAGMIQRITA